MPCTRHRVFLATLIVTAKYLNDSSPKNIHWANYAVLFDVAEVNLMEKQLLFLLDFDLRFDEIEVLQMFKPFLANVPENAGATRAEAVDKVSKAGRARAAQAQAKLQVIERDSENESLLTLPPTGNTNKKILDGHSLLLQTTSGSSNSSTSTSSSSSAALIITNAVKTIARRLSTAHLSSSLSSTSTSATAQAAQTTASNPQPAYKHTALDTELSETSQTSSKSSSHSGIPQLPLTSDNTDSSGSSSSSDGWLSDEDRNEDLRVQVATSSSSTGMANRFAQDITQELYPQDSKDIVIPLFPPTKSSNGLSRNTTIKPAPGRLVRGRKGNDSLQLSLLGPVNDAQRTPLKRHNLAAAAARSALILKPQPSQIYAAGLNASSTMPHLSDTSGSTMSPAPSAATSSTSPLVSVPGSQGITSSVSSYSSRTFCGGVGSPTDATPTRRTTGRARSGTIAGITSMSAAKHSIPNLNSSVGSGSSGRSAGGFLSRMWGGLRTQATNHGQIQ